MTNTFSLTPEQQEQFDSICKELQDGTSLKKACAQKGVPARSTFYNWLERDIAAGNRFMLLDKYTRAMEYRAESLADELQDLADRADIDRNEKRVRLDAHKWIASKLKPRS